MVKKRSLPRNDATPPSKKRRSSMDISNNKDSHPTASSATLKSGHMRFGSEEMELANQSPAQEDVDSVSGAQDLEEASEDGDSDDDAPEAVGTADAQAVAKAEAVEAAKALQADRLKARKERQDRAAQLKAQSVNTSRKQKQTAQHDAADDTEWPRKSARPVIPDLLPDDILADETIGQRESPEQEDESDELVLKPASNRRILKFDSKPRDVDAGPVRVRVLEGRNRYMAPKANKTAGSIKENWLSGRRGKTSAVERHKPNRGFLTS